MSSRSTPSSRRISVSAARAVSPIDDSRCAPAAGIPGGAQYYDDPVYEDTAISTSGYFIHAAPWSVGSQGRADVSHGCVNLSNARATTYYNFSIPGDVVQIDPEPRRPRTTYGPIRSGSHLRSVSRSRGSRPGCDSISVLPSPPFASA